jgi:AraC family transcriptional regulator, regulatory protein of adaptative response / DNA-3-methyladenine glycosylase II
MPCGDSDARCAVRRHVLHGGEDDGRVLPSGVSGEDAPRQELHVLRDGGGGGSGGIPPVPAMPPELSPAPRMSEENAGLVRQFLARIQNDGLFDESLEDAADRLGVSSRHLRRAVEQECGVSPLELVRTTRLLFARRLLSTTTLPVSSVAFGSGFGSLARFNHDFRARYDTTPTEFRQRTSRAPCIGAGRNPVNAGVARTVCLGRGAGLSHQARHPGCGIGARWTVLPLAANRGRRGWIAVGRGKGGVDVEVSDGLATQLLPVAGRVRNLFDLDTNPDAIRSVLAKDELLRPMVERLPGLRVPGTCDPFELAVRAILGQQVTVAAASTLAGEWWRVSRNRRRSCRRA